MSTFLEELAKWATGESQTTKPRRKETLAAFLAVREDVKEAIAAGYALKTIWEHMHETGHDALGLYVDQRGYCVHRFQLKGFKRKLQAALGGFAGVALIPFFCTDAPADVHTGRKGCSIVLFTQAGEAYTLPVFQLVYGKIAETFLCILLLHALYECSSTFPVLRSSPGCGSSTTSRYKATTTRCS